MLGLTVIGEIESVALTFRGPEGSDASLALTARVDTGARTSALHALEIEEFEHNGLAFVRFQIALREATRTIEAPLVKQAVVKAAGKFEVRYFIEGHIITGQSRAPIQISLSDRSSMQYPVLLGRNFLSGKYLVDVGRKFVLQQNLRYPVVPLYPSNFSYPQKTIDIGKRFG